MNYRHAYHAGNFADVLKHAVLAWIARYLQQKVAPLVFIDTHAGTGIYDLTAVPSQKTLEANDGIQRLLNRPDLPPPLKPYIDLVRLANAGEALSNYPGSAALMAALARADDRVLACELHPEDAVVLRKSLGQTPKRRIVEGDGYHMLLAQTPPPEKRGLVLIDPPFEEAGEFERLARTFIAAHRKWPLGVFALWFPIKDPGEVARFKAELANAAIKRLTFVAIDVARAEGLGACGLVLCNAPFTFDAEWRPALAYLTQALAQGPAPSFELDTLSGE